MVEVGGIWGDSGIQEFKYLRIRSSASRSPRRFISPSTLYPSSLNGLVYDTSVTFGMHVAISKQRFLYLRSILRGHFVTSRLSAPVMAFALHATKTFGDINYCERRKDKERIKINTFCLNQSH